MTGRGEGGLRKRCGLGFKRGENLKRQVFPRSEAERQPGRYTDVTIHPPHGDIFIFILSLMNCGI